MSTFNPLPAHQAQALGQLVAATLDGIGDVALSEDAPKPPTWAQLANLRDAACKTPAPTVALSAPRWEATKPAASRQTVKVVNGATPVQRRAAEIIAHEKVRDFEARYGAGATLEEAREQDAADEYLRRIGVGR
ncbi:hypothetical protein BJF77_11060 [Kocuria sp. CNJ-770]|uniref:hypothetical protein n=1 Tax=Kocuria sp. CNJ-770 TaxID=1904964 RepID=UPI00095BEE5D|nr:hypothetical protein [Kocuria sp. CNJ-770]OLT09319.1 hypothetical protein BJF77_11060 [Kocuria sp. CNJ-770]